jgi:hypothetical protein
VSCDWCGGRDAHWDYCPETKIGDLQKKVDQLTSAAADCARATVTALDRLILAEAVCVEAEKFLNRQGNRFVMYAAVEAWRKGQPS